MKNECSEKKTLAEKMEDIAREYFASRGIINSKGGFLSPDWIEEDNSTLLYIQKVQHAYAKLNDVERGIINNDFFYQSYPTWWKSIYNKSTYYRYKNLAMKKFLELFENE